MNLTEQQLDALNDYIRAIVRNDADLCVTTGRAVREAGAALQRALADEDDTELLPIPRLTLPITPGRYESVEGVAYLVVYITSDPEVDYPVIGFEEGNGFDSPECWTLTGTYYRGEPNEHDLVKRLGDLP